MKSPSKLPLWFNHISFEELRDSGYIDTTSDFVGDTLRCPVHPIFAFERWLNMDPAVYQSMHSALRLASQMLTAPTFLPFWYGLKHNRRLIRNQLLSSTYGRLGERFDPPMGPLNDMQKVDILRDLEYLGQIHTWGFARLEYADATTHIMNWQGLLHSPDTHGSHTELSDEYTRILQQTAVGHLPGEMKAPSSPPTHASYLRTSFHFAKTLVHELCHAFNWAVVSYNPTSPRPEVSIKIEPFFMDQVRCELGRAWESFVFGGYIDGIGDGLHMHYGMFVSKWPHCHSDEGQERAPSRRAYRSQYAIPMAFIQDVWTWQFWSRVEMFGGGECWPIKSHGGQFLGLRKPTTTTFDDDTEWAEFFSDTSSIASEYQGRNKLRAEFVRRRMQKRWKKAVGHGSTCGSDSSEGRGHDGNGVVRIRGAD
ncbi:hypothetical protein IWX49DRAFT_43508 [Phyllosticta citricarpa]|uniref:Uncharacterized protein n=1 Tax=Phyllosticta paracitricarpa TaxID=2016321 RepID=A0ABR1N8L3_9PEZI